MRKHRFIPVLLLDARQRLVKTVRFGERTYVGDPFNAIRLFNEKEVDEICVLDIDATIDGRPPDLKLIGELASECFMPLAYGGGITSVAQCEQMTRLGVEKFVLGSAALAPGLVEGIAQSLGSQAIAACVDVSGSDANARCMVRAGRTPLALTPIDYCRRLQSLGVGEIILQSIDCDGARTGYDLALIRSVASFLDIPLVALGGAGDFAHLPMAIEAGASAAASGSAFVFIGRLRAVLITYPETDEG